MEEQIKVIVESYQKDGIDKKTGQQVYRVYFDFVDIKSYYLFLKSLSERFETTDTSVFGIIDCEKILSMKITDDSFSTSFFSLQTQWYSGFELIYRNKPLYFRFIDGQYILNESNLIESIAKSINNQKFEVSQDNSFIKWFTLDIQELDITEIVRKQ